MTMTLSLVAPPAWASISASGVLSIAPTAPLGAQVLTVRATDGAVTATRLVTVTVLPAGKTQYAQLVRKAGAELVLRFDCRRAARSGATSSVSLSFDARRPGAFGKSQLRLATGYRLVPESAKLAEAVSLAFSTEVRSSYAEAGLALAFETTVN